MNINDMSRKDHHHYYQLNSDLIIHRRHVAGCRRTWIYRSWIGNRRHDETSWGWLYQLGFTVLQKILLDS